MFINILGCGNMGSALVSGFAQSQSSDEITIWDPNPEKCEALAEKYGVQIASSPEMAVKTAEMLILCIKPQKMEKALLALKPYLLERHLLLVTVAAGLEHAFYSKILAQEYPLVRAMPNTLVQILSGVTGLHANAAVSLPQRDRCLECFAKLGSAFWVDDEAMLHAVTALSGSGPAYFYRILRLMIEKGVALGLSTTEATRLVLKTAEGVCNNALMHPEQIAALEAQIVAPGGTTEAALHALEKAGIQQAIDATIETAFRKSQALSQVL